jgi:hypothetical protein
MLPALVQLQHGWSSSKFSPADLSLCCARLPGALHCSLVTPFGVGNELDYCTVAPGALKQCSALNNPDPQCYFNRDCDVSVHALPDDKCPPTRDSHGWAGEGNEGYTRDTYSHFEY